MVSTVAVTGANRGIGLAAARCLADSGHTVILVCRDRASGREALTSLAPVRGGEPHHLVVADLASLDSVRQGARRILDLDKPLAALVNNAAALPLSRMVSRDGFELQLAVTHLGHFLLTRKLLPLLGRRAGPRERGDGRRHPGASRVVTVSSGAHHGPRFDFTDPNFERKRYRRLEAYQQSKLANVLFTLALARRVADTGIEPVALHPGVYDTGILRDYFGRIPGGAAAAGLLAKHPRRAGPMLAGLAAERREENLTGAYLDKGVVSQPSAESRRREDQERLWEWSKAAVGG